MAILNFNNFSIKSVFPLSFFPSSFFKQHENKSCSLPKLNTQELIFTPFEIRVLSMRGKTFYVELDKPIFPDAKVLGNLMVESVVLFDNLPPEVGLLDSNDGSINYYSLDQIFVGPQVIKSV